MSMFGRKRTAEPAMSAGPENSKGQDPHEAALNWEAARIHQVEKSERRAWTIASVAVVCASLLVVGYVFILPLKENTPYVIYVDKTTGVPDILTKMDSKGVSFDEVMDKYWLSQYTRARETFDWYTVQKDYNTVGLLSSANVGAEYAKLFEGSNALDKKYGNTIRVTVEIVSVIPNGNGIGTVRFIKTTKRTDDPNSPGTVTKWVATIGYEYRNPSLIHESARLVNPFGFQVLSFRVDPEMGAK